MLEGDSLAVFSISMQCYMQKSFIGHDKMKHFEALCETWLPSNILQFPIHHHC